MATVIITDIMVLMEILIVLLVMVIEVIMTTKVTKGHINHWYQCHHVHKGPGRGHGHDRSGFIIVCQ